MTNTVICRCRPLLPWVVVVQALVIVWLGTSQSSSGYWCTEVATPVFRKTSHGESNSVVASGGMLLDHKKDGAIKMFFFHIHTRV